MQHSWIRYQLPAIGYMVFIFIMSSIPRLSLPDVGVRWEDKIAHLVEYLVLAFLLARAFYYQNWKSLTIRDAVRWAVVVAIVYGATDEFHQYFVPGRFADVTDWVADSLGAFLGGVVAHRRLHLADQLSQN